MKWEYTTIQCNSGKAENGQFGSHIYLGKTGGYYPFISTHAKVNDENMPILGDGFGLSVLDDIGTSCARGSITITIIDSGKEIQSEETVSSKGLGITTNFHQHAKKIRHGELSGKPLIITITFDFCEGKDVYKVTAVPNIPIGQKRRSFR